MYDVSQALHIEIAADSHFPLFQKNLKKPSKNRKFAWARGFSGLIYARDTESPRTDVEGEGVSQD
jgi:hypothetical protein